MTGPATETKSLRFFHLDALRGVAALGVLIYHVAACSALSPVWAKVAPEAVNTGMKLLQHGVEVFFVLSGWVIAHSMRRESLAFSSLGRFLTRRALRLTPPYWAAIVLAVLLGVVGRRLGSDAALPGLRDIALNFVYLQNLVGARNAFTPAWTLCIEAQFYIVFAATLWLASLSGKKGAGDEVYGGARLPLAVLLLGGMLISLALTMVWANTALFVSWWYYFAGGALGYLASRDTKLRPLIFTGLVAMGALAVLLHSHNSAPRNFEGAQAWTAVVVGALALTYLLLAHGRETWMSWGQAGIFEWLGRVSYSLYLTHFGFGLLLARVLRKVAHNNAGLALVCVLSDMGLCLVLAGAFWKWVEQPSIEWAKKFKLRSDAVREPSGPPASTSASVS